MLFWIMFVSDLDNSNVEDPSNLFSTSTIINFLQSPFTTLIIAGLVFYFFYDPVLFVIFKPLFNTCNYCKKTRNSPNSVLANGQCAKCKTHVCSLCFSFRDTRSNKSMKGCPNCGSNTYLYKRVLGYPFLHIPELFITKYHDLRKRFRKDMDKIIVGEHN